MEHLMQAVKKSQEQVFEYLSMHLAIVEARSGESNEEAWRRHLAQNPQDHMANVKIFNRGSGARLRG
jgi:hypothetical protein